MKCSTIYKLHIMSNKKLFKLGTRDFLKGMVIAILTGIGTALTIPEPTLKSVGIASLVGLISYLTKNLFTNSKDEILKSEPK